MRTIETRKSECDFIALQDKERIEKGGLLATYRVFE